MHFCDDVARVKDRRSLPVNTSLNGAMPAFTNINVGSFCGMSDAEAQTSCPFDLKNSRNDARTSEAVLLMIGPTFVAPVLPFGHGREAPNARQPWLTSKPSRKT